MNVSVANKNKNNNINSNPSFGKLAFLSTEAKAAFRESLRRHNNPAFEQQFTNLIEAHRKIKTLVLTDGKEFIEVPNGTYSTQKTFLVTLFDALRSRLSSPTAKIKTAKKPIDKLIENCPIITREQFNRTQKHSHLIGLVLTSDPSLPIAVADPMRF